MFTLYISCSISTLQFHPSAVKTWVAEIQIHTHTHPEAFVLIYLFQRKSECALVPGVVMVTKVCRMQAESACSASSAMWFQYTNKQPRFSSDEGHLQTWKFDPDGWPESCILVTVRFVFTVFLFLFFNTGQVCRLVTHSLHRLGDVILHHQGLQR